MINKYKYHFILHFTILIWGFTGVLGKHLDVSGMESMPIVVYRMLIGWTTLLIFTILIKKSIKIDPKGLFKTLGTGVIIAAHWWAFFKAIELSNVSIALIFMSTTALFTSFVEPIIAKKKFDYKELMMGVIVALGIAVIINDLYFNVNQEYIWAIILALISALLAAVFSIINSVLVKEYDSKLITLYEIFGGFIAISITTICVGNHELSEFNISLYQFMLLFILGSVCTSFAFLMGVYVMKFIPAYTVNLSVNMEPIYAIILALVFFGSEEIMSLNFYIGSAIVVGTILMNAYFKRAKKSH
jgi:drug/metabolite transporter (DMT)-like permease